MPYKREPCRNFQRGSCQYGERCKFLHLTPQNQQQQQQQQQPKPSNPFGFGTQQQQQQKPNPFGFGVHNNSQSKRASDFSNRHQQQQQQQFKPFENKWTRFSPISNGGALSSRQPDNQSQATNHKCTDPESCKRVIAEDFDQERPLWKLTCYAHCMSAPCDITGDISYEELRAKAYDDARHGLSLQSIVERERNLLSSKLIEFENLLCNPCIAPPVSALASQSAFPGATSSRVLPNVQTSVPPPVSSFSQMGPSLNVGFELRPSPPSNIGFGQPNLFSNSSQSSNAVGIRPLAPSNNAFGQPNLFSNSGQTSGAFVTNNFPSGNAGSFSRQLPNQASGSSLSPNIAGLGIGSVVNAQTNLFSTAALPIQSPSIQPATISNRPNSASDAVCEASTNIPSLNNLQRETVSGDMSIWLKENWIPGEIPEEAPPDAFV